MPDQIVWYEDGSDSTGGCIPGALCDDAASRSWPEPGQYDPVSPLDIALLVLVVWLAASASFVAFWIVLKDFARR